MLNSKIKHVAIAGNIGAGKTTLARMLGEHFSWDVQYEDVNNNPYLEDFYENMLRWSFNLQVFFLNSRFRQIINIKEGGQPVIQDRTIYEDAKIFAPNLHDMGLMSTRDFENYSSLFSVISNQIGPPDLLIYLKATVPVLVAQIQNRGRAFEENLRMDYLKRLNAYYENWIAEYHEGPLLVLEVDNLDIVNSKEDLAHVITQVTAALNDL